MEKGDFELAFKDANYAITDDYIRRIMNNSARVNPQGIQREILFRVGRTIDGRYELPSNFDIYASLVAALVGRYSGNISLSSIPLKIAYWEIWNEPDLTFFWNSNDLNRYYAFYSKIAWKIKELDPNAKVGGPGVANGYNPGGAYLDGPLSFCRTNNVPLDFLWYYYANTTSDPQNIIDIGNNIQNALQRYGFCSAESLCNEWNSTPQASVNVFTKVQSAQNASYIASSLIYMQSCKVDRAYYYRSDALTFGLFNDEPNPVDRNYKSFCTYAAQAFAMFNQLKQTPNLLTTSNTFATGISVLAGKSGNTVKILVANHRIDRSLSQPNVPPPSGRLYRQHYVDSGREVAQMTDDWTVQHYFGGKNPATLRSNNVVNQQSIAQQIPNNGRLSPRSRNYGESSGGVSLNVTNLPQNVASLEARRITEGADLSGILAPIMGNVSLRMDGSTCVISDPGAVEYSVTLYTLTLGNTPVNPNNSTNPGNPGNPTNPTQPGAGGSRRQGDHFIFQVNLFTNFTSTIYMAPSGAPANFFVPQNSVWAVRLTVSDAMMTGLVGTTDGAPFTVINSGYYGRGVRQVRMDVRFTRSGFMNELFQSPPCGITLNFGGLINRRDTVWVTFTYRY